MSAKFPRGEAGPFLARSLYLMILAVEKCRHIAFHVLTNDIKGKDNESSITAFPN